MTELEGAILALLGTDGPMTAYAVRKVFLDSPSSFWSGSAGAIYPALKRMEKAGLVQSEDATRGHRAASALSLTPEGRAAAHAWSSDAATAIGAGYDPFRIRVGSWKALPPDGRAALKRQLVTRIEARLAEMADPAYRPDDRDRIALETALQRARLDWLRTL